MNFNMVEEINRDYDKYIVFFFQGEIKFPQEIYNENRFLIENFIIKNKFSGKSGEKTEVNFIRENKVLTYVYIGLGSKDEFISETLRQVIFEALNKESGNLLLSLPEYSGEDLSEIVAEMSCYLNYSFDKYKSGNINKPISLNLLKDRSKEGAAEGTALGEGVCIARNLINEPANVIYPETLGNLTAEYGEKYGFQVEIKDEEEIKALGMEAYLAVARAAEKRPKLIIMRYMGDPENQGVISGLVGKGITYDTGGLSLKSSEGMIGMKNDMGGAATIIGAMTTVSRMKIRKNIVAVVAACENSIGGDAYRPGDVIGSMGGKTIEILNTDTEGRLTLADAITYSIRNEGVTEIIDVATLTGAVIASLGFEATGAFTNSDRMYKKIEEASDRYGELVWRLPLFDKYKKAIKSDIADLANSGGRWGGAVTAAKFLEEFTEGLPWLHLDIAGTSFYSEAQEYYPKGATGKVVRALYSYFKEV